MNSLLDDFKNAFKRPNYELYQVIYLTVAFWLVQAFLSIAMPLAGFKEEYNFLLRLFAMSADIDVLKFRPWTILTYIFPHGDIFHILFNMLILYYFGKLVVEYLGSRKFLVIYLLGALSGAVLFFTVYNLVDAYAAPDSQLRSIYQMGSPLIGASGGVLAIVVAAATLIPNYTFYLIFLGPVKIKYIALFYAVISYLGLMGSNAGGELAHLGGVAFGFIYIKQLQSGNDIGHWFSLVIDWVVGLFKPRSNIRVTYRKEEKKKTGTKQKGPVTSQDEIDAILDKISDSGYDSLSKEEKRKLFEASKK